MLSGSGGFEGRTAGSGRKLQIRMDGELKMKNPLSHQLSASFIFEVPLDSMQMSGDLIHGADKPLTRMKYVACGDNRWNRAEKGF